MAALGRGAAARAGGDPPGEAPARRPVVRRGRAGPPDQPQGGDVLAGAGQMAARLPDRFPRRIEGEEALQDLPAPKDQADSRERRGGARGHPPEDPGGPQRSGSPPHGGPAHPQDAGGRLQRRPDLPHPGPRPEAALPAYREDSSRITGGARAPGLPQGGCRRPFR